MTAAEDTLLLADGPVADALAGQLGPERCQGVADPYDALMAMGRRRWDAVVLTGPRTDFAGLCRASRRLARDSRLYAVCAPAGEVEVRGLLGDPLDDYFIWPLARRDLDGLRRRPAPPAGGGGAHPGGVLQGRQAAELIEVAHSVQALEVHLAERVGSLVSAAVTWIDVDKLPAGVEPLLLAAGEAPRLLVPPGPVRLSDAARSYLAAVQECLPVLLASAVRTRHLHHLSVTDHLTGAYNRRFFYHATDRVLLRARREALRVTLLLYDIDDFKRYNDTYGHAAGDEILRETAVMMKQITRSHDIVARIGGDEFAVLFWDPDKPRSPNSRPPETAYALTDRFRRILGTHTFTSLGPEARGQLTISGGLASFPVDGQDVRELLRKADRALRDVKALGKNGIRLVGRD